MARALDLAAVLIVRNEARCLARCLASVKHWVDRIVVVDTGSTDATVSIALAAGAQVHHMVWPDDFAAARNHALACADAAWNLIIDADEWIEQGGAALRAFCEGEERLGRLCVISNDDTDPTNPQEVRSWITRLIPRGARFAGRIHEQVDSSLPRHDLPVLIGHDGYLAAQRIGKQSRNLPLLLAELAAQPEDAYIQFQLGKDAESYGHHAQACEWYAKALTRTPRAPWRHDLVVRHLHCLGQTGRLDEALQLAEAEAPDYAASPDLFFVLGNLCLDSAMVDPAHAITHWIPRAIEAWQTCLAIGERPDLEGSVTGRGSHLAQHNLQALQGGLASVS